MTNALPHRDDCVLYYALQHRAAEHPDRTYAVFDDGTQWSYRETLERTQKLAAGLQGLGIKQGDHVVVWLPNGKAAIECYFAINYLGAVYVPINTGYRGDLLAHVIDNSDAKVIIAHHELAPRLRDVQTAELTTVVSVGGNCGTIGDLCIADYAELKNGQELAPLERAIEPWETQSIIYTSGTTGPSKGVLSSYYHNQATNHGEAWRGTRDDDRFFINMPMFHVGGCFIVYAMMLRGGSITVSSGFSTSQFWDQARRTESTIVFLLGAMATFLLKEPIGRDDKNHPVRAVYIVPMSEEALTFADRFGVEVYTLFNMTEISTPISSEIYPDKVGLCGRPRDGYQVRIVDEHDIEVPVGEMGQLIVRTDNPWTLNHGYYKNPEASVEAWRNGWFHTGDRFRRDDAGNYFFVDRIKDAIRRRGENISSAEVEAQIISHPAVKECAAIAVPSEYGEDDVMCALATLPDQTIDPAELIDYLSQRMAHFMVPRYVRVMASLPKTPTEKIQKAELRKAGITADTWDREEAGIRLRAEKLN